MEEQSDVADAITGISWYIPRECRCRDLSVRAHVWVDQQFDNLERVFLFGVCIKTIFPNHFLLPTYYPHKYLSIFCVCIRFSPN